MQQLIGPRSRSRAQAGTPVTSLRLSVRCRGGPLGSPLGVLRSNDVNRMHRCIIKGARSRSSGAAHPAPQPVNVVLHSIVPLPDAALRSRNLKLSRLPQSIIGDRLWGRAVLQT